VTQTFSDASFSRNGNFRNENVSDAKKWILNPESGGHGRLRLFAAFFSSTRTLEGTSKKLKNFSSTLHVSQHNLVISTIYPIPGTSLMLTKDKTVERSKKVNKTLCQIIVRVKTMKKYNEEIG
jgi:hypothetical protein